MNEFEEWWYKMRENFLIDPKEKSAAMLNNVDSNGNQPEIRTTQK